MGANEETWWNLENLVTAYAAVVATGALFLEVRRWFESGVRLSLSYMLDAVKPEDQLNHPYIFIEVSNRGEAATTITHLVFRAYDSRLAHWRRKPSQTFIAIDPSISQRIPYFLEPGGRWIGMCTQTTELNQLIGTNLLFAELHATHADRPVSVLLKRRAEINGKEISIGNKNGQG